MDYKNTFLSLKWKLLIIIGSVFLVVHAIFSCFAYRHTVNDFMQDREIAALEQIESVNALTDQAFRSLEQFAELLVSLEDFPITNHQLPAQTTSLWDRQWHKWQVKWGIEKIAFYDHGGSLLKVWGFPQSTNDEQPVSEVLKTRQVQHRIYCAERCFLQVFVPVIDQSTCKGVLGVVRELDDVLGRYHGKALTSFAVLTPQEASSAEHATWPYKLQVTPTSEHLLQLFGYLSGSYPIDQFLAHSKTIVWEEGLFRTGLMPIGNTKDNKTVLLMFADDITDQHQKLEKSLKKIWLYGALSLLAAICLLWLVLHGLLKRIANLSLAMPMLSARRYHDFKNQLSLARTGFVGQDELDQFCCGALSLADQLENLELNTRRNTQLLMEKSHELAKERDVSQQLVENAPIIVITQKLNGSILTINKVGLDTLGLQDDEILGQLFDGFLPEQDHEHLIKLGQLRRGDLVQRVQVDSFLTTATGQSPYISWLHSLIKASEHRDEAIILTLGMDISARRIAEESMLKMTSHDYLTGLTNRRKFHEEFAVELAMAKRYGYQIALFYLDLDQFKLVNDSGGHEAGDQLLVEVAHFLKKTLRSTDLLSRIGGDEFAVIMPHIENQSIENIAQKLCNALSTLNFNYQGKSYKMTASVGISIFPSHGNSISELLANADMAMYEAKGAGRGQFHIYSENCNYQLKLGRILYWREIIEQAIAENKFVLLFQPILDIAANTISHYECLIRIKQDDGQLLPPGDFIGYAEELGLIGQIDRWVLSAAVQKLIEFKCQGKDYGLSVNLSGRSFNDTSIFADISRLLRLPGVDPGKIIFEITETAAVSNFAAAELLINQIRALGCRLALDDFGVGFSSFYYLKQFPVDYVKIDGSFIRQLEKSEDDQIFVKSLTGVALAFDKKTVAEFVETEAALALLKEYGVDYAQGYFIGRPVALD